MNFKQNFLIAVLVTLVCVGSSVFAGTYGGGSGTSEDPYQLWTPQQLNTIGANPSDWASHFKLMADIDMSIYTGTQYNIIGNQTTEFTGTFDGNGHILANVIINQPGINGVGLFGVLGSGGQISNLRVENANVVGHTWVGILCGRNHYGMINQSCVTGVVTGNDNVGGLCGETWGPITRCYANSTVTGSNANVGGLCGGNRYTTISQSYAAGTVHGNSYVGGLCGGNELGTISQCYAAGTVTGNGGGLCGGNYYGTVTDCFWDTQTSGLSYSSGGTGKTTVQMQTLSTFTDAGWDFSATDGDAADWFMPYRQYPRLLWEPSYGQTSGGSGTAVDPYLIYTAVQMNTIGLNPGDWAGYFKLMADIDMSAYTGIQYNIIGNGTTPFTGSFDGNGHIIRNLTYTTTTAVNYVGLFGYINNATIQKLGLENVTLSTAGSWVGGLAGHKAGTVTACYVNGGSVGGSWAVGGLIGNNEAGPVVNCYATDAVNSTGAFSGGLIGRYWLGSVSDCYCTGTINGSSYVGGFAGWNNAGTFTACFWNTQTSGQSVAVSYGPSAGIAGKITAQMQTLSTFTDAGWDFSASDGDPSDWWMPNRQYPCLFWQPHYSGGSGTAAEPYQIANKADLLTLGATIADYNKYFILTADIDLTGETFTTAVIATSSYPCPYFSEKRFTGSFDGNHKKIMNLRIDTAGAAGYYLGLFGTIGSAAQVKDLGIESTVITGGDCSLYVGALCGDNYSGTISNCYATGSITCGNSSENIGGLCGTNSSGTISNCYATNSVTCETAYNLGSLCGSNSGTISNCYAAGSVTCETYSTNLGGLCGSNSGTISNCYTAGSVACETYSVNLGGLCGSNSGTISNCYTTGFVVGGTPSAALGGLCGYNGNGTVSHCYFYLYSGPDNRLGTVLDTGQMIDQSSFDGFDFAGNPEDGTEDYWTITSDHCPKLSWQTDDGPLSPNFLPATSLFGSGRADNPFQINNAGDFAEFISNNQLHSGYYVLTCDIDLSGQSFTAAVINRGFGGQLDGGDHRIANITINADEYTSYLGIFSHLSGSICNLVIENISITGGNCPLDRFAAGVCGTNYLGGLCGYNYYGMISNCSVTGSVTGGDFTNQIGGLCGVNDGGMISNCSVTGSVTSGYGSLYIGGLCGVNDGGAISNCSASVISVRGTKCVGGLVGENSSGTISSCFASGTVYGVGNIYHDPYIPYDDSVGIVGGLVGFNNYGTINNCFAIGSVTSEAFSNGIGGLMGYNSYGNVIISDNFSSCSVNNTGQYIGELAGGSNSPITIQGNIPINSIDSVHSLRWNNLVLEGSGTLNLGPDVSLILNNSTVSCNISGTGKVQIDIDKTLAIQNTAVVNLPGNENHPGIQCDGLLQVKDSATISNTDIQVTRLKFEGDVDISNSVVTAEAGSPYGQFFIEDTVQVKDNEIHADGDRYMDLDPSVFAGLIANNIIYVTITEGAGSTRGGLFELRGDPNLADNPCPSGDFFCYLENIPAFNTHSWTLEELKLVDGAKVNLTNRFDFGNGGHNEVLYVKKLILGANSQLNTAFNRLYYGQLEGDPNCIKNKPLLGFSLNNVACDNENEFVSRIVYNNYIDPDPAEPDYSRIHVSRITGASPDPKGMIRMCNLTDMDPQSSTYNQIINARAKALFAKASEEKILVYFQYLFETSDPAAQLVIYLTDAPQIMSHSDPDFSSHCLEVARLLPPLPGQAGSEGSGRFGVFSKEVFRQNLDFIRGTRIEFELIGPAGSCILIDNWDPQVWCSGVYCSDIDGDYGVNELDFLTILAECGATASVTSENNSKACLDGAFSRDGYVDSYDAMTWDWLLNTTTRPEHLCGACLSKNSAGCASNALLHFPPTTIPVSFQSTGKGLLVAGKQGASSDTKKRNDMLGAMDHSGQRTDSTLLNKRTNGKLVLSPDAQLYQVNIEEGLIRLADCNSVVSPAAFPFANEPRYNRSSTVYVGLQNDRGNWYGRPILDAALDANGFVYVVPIVVEPVGREPYLAAAKLQLLPGQTPGYHVIRLYDDPDAGSPNDNRNLTGLREVKVDGQGHLYVLNAHKDNESNILWKYDAQTGVLINRLGLDNDANIPAPTGLYVSDPTGTLYLASSQNAADANSTSVRGLDTNTFATLRTITIHNMGHVTGITGNPATGSIYVTGFTLSNIPEYLTENAMPFYAARLAEIPLGNNNPVTAIDISNSSGDPNDYLALPVSIVFLGNDTDAPCGGADLYQDGRVDSRDFAILASQWLSMPGVPSADIAPNPIRDNYVDIKDLTVLAQHWMETGCNNP